MDIQNSENETSVPSEQRASISRKRRSHKKVKTGCAVCKRRRIKCDERKPSCQNCEKHRAKCNYPTSTEQKGSEVHDVSARALSTSGSAKSEPEHDLTEHNNPHSVYPQSRLQDMWCLGTDSFESIHGIPSTSPPVINTYICPFYRKSTSLLIGVPPERRLSPWL